MGAAPTPNPQSPIIDVIYAGGTISSHKNAEGAREGGHFVPLASLLDLPELPPYTIGREDLRYEGLSENMLVADQANLTDSMLTSIRQGNSSVTTHGTDSMVQMARYADRVVGTAARLANVKVILTGANEDMDHPQTDVWENLRFAFDQAAASISPPGAYVAFHGRLIPASEVARLPYTLDARPTFGSSASAKYQRAVEVQRQTIQSQQEALLKLSGTAPNPRGVHQYPVNVVRSDHKKFLEDILADQQARCVLLKLYHSGTANTDKPEQSVAELVRYLRALRPELTFFGASENGEPVDLRTYETSVALRRAGVVPLYTMIHDVAATKLALLDTALSPGERISRMLQNQVGEIDPAMVQERKSDVEHLLGLYDN